MSAGAHGLSTQAGGWEQLATGRPRNKGRFEQPACLHRVSGQLTLPGMPRMALSVAYHGPHGIGTVGPKAHWLEDCLLVSVLWGPLFLTKKPSGLGQSHCTGFSAMQEGEVLTLTARILPVLVVGSEGPGVSLEF